MDNSEKKKEGRVFRIAKEGVQSSGPTETDPRKPVRSTTKKSK